MSEKVFIDWNKFQEDTKHLASKLQQVIEPSTELVTISRGGLFVGGLLSYMLDIKNIHNVAITSYTQQENNANETVKLLEWGIPYGDHYNNEVPLLFVDDINDTSKTYRFILEECRKRNLTNVKFATVYHKNKPGNLTPQSYADQIDHLAWVVFPWDEL